MMKNIKYSTLTILLFCFVFVIESCKKEGCTNELATNYDVSAEKDDGSCILANKEEEEEEEEEEKEEEPISPAAPTKVIFDIVPSNGETDVNSPLTITWFAATDEDGDAISYDVFLGEESGNPILVSENQTGLSFTSDALELGTTYYLRVDSKSGTDITPSEVRNFTSANTGSFTDDRDMKEYGTILIGKQIWMTSNLMFASSGSYSYDDIASNDAKYGKLYEWTSVTAAIPEGWHLPTDAEWKILETELGMSASDLEINNYTSSRGTDQGTQLKEGGTSGLNFPLAGFRSGSSYSALDNRTYMWTNTDAGGSNIIRRRLVTGDASCYRFTNPSAGFAISVRLVKD